MRERGRERGRKGERERVGREGRRERERERERERQRQTDRQTDRQTVESRFGFFDCLLTYSSDSISSDTSADLSGLDDNARQRRMSERILYQGDTVAWNTGAITALRPKQGKTKGAANGGNPKQDTV